VHLVGFIIRICHDARSPERHIWHILHFVSDFVRIPHLVDETMVPQTSEGLWLINNGKLANPWTITNSDERHCSSLDNSQ